MSRSACAKQNTHQSECILQKTLHHEQILSGNRSKDSQIPEALLTPFKTGYSSVCLQRIKSGVPGSHPPSTGVRNKVPASGLVALTYLYRPLQNEILSW